MNIFTPLGTAALVSFLMFGPSNMIASRVVYYSLHIFALAGAMRVMSSLFDGNL